MGKEGVEKGVTAKISHILRPHPNAAIAHAKVSGFYSLSMLAKMDALDSGFDETIMLDSGGNIGECSGENIFIVKDGSLLTPPADAVLLGITRNSVMQLAKAEGISLAETTITKEMLFGAEECFITGTAAEITPIIEVNKKAIGSGKPGPITKKMQKIYDDLVHGRLEKWEEWLEFV